jgi:hypothetical protein
LPSQEKNKDRTIIFNKMSDFFMCRFYTANMIFATG